MAMRRQGQPRPTVALATAALFAAFLISLIFSSAALAIFVRPEVANFGPDGTAGSSFAGNTDSSQLAINQATKSLYTVGGGASPGIYGFDVSDPLIHPPLSN